MAPDIPLSLTFTYLMVWSYPAVMLISANYRRGSWLHTSTQYHAHLGSICDFPLKTRRRCGSKQVKRRLSLVKR